MIFINEVIQICIIKYSTKYINLISIIVSITIYFLIQPILNFSNFNFYVPNIQFKANFVTNKIDDQKNDNIYSENNSNITSEENTKVNNYNEKNIESVVPKWYLEIPSINLKAEIAEGTSKTTMDNYIGHFEETNKTTGNIGLAAHNRGYKNNYFQNLKKLKEGDIIYYHYNDFNKKYIVTKHVIIKDTDWTNLEETEDNVITLITCIENEPEYRRCIQGIEQK